MEREIEATAFQNLGDHAIVVVAVKNIYEGELFDWTAYIGTGSSQSIPECAEHVAKHGNKLPSWDAEHYFPHLPMEKWRK